MCVLLILSQLFFMDLRKEEFLISCADKAGVSQEKRLFVCVYLLSALMAPECHFPSKF